MITKEQLLYIFWPWGEVKRLRKAVAKYMVESANVMVQLDKVGEQIKTLKGQQEMGRNWLPTSLRASRNCENSYVSRSRRTNN